MKFTIPIPKDVQIELAEYRELDGRLLGPSVVLQVGIDLFSTPESCERLAEWFESTAKELREVSARKRRKGKAHVR